MLRRNRSSVFSLLLPAVLMAALAVLFSCDQSPIKTDDVAGDLNGTAKIEPAVTGTVLLGSVTDTVAPHGLIEVWATNVSFDSETGMVTLDVKLVNLTRRTITPSIHFVITEVRPEDIAVVDFDGSTPGGLPFYDFSDMLGPDGVLSPGESTGFVTMKFHTVTARSFSIGFRLEFGMIAGSGVIGGVVFRDDNKDGIRERCDRCEPGIPGITVVLMMMDRRDRDYNHDGDDDDGDDGHCGDSTNTWPGTGRTLVTRTEPDGSYRFEGLPEGAYRVLIIVSPDQWTVTTTYPLIVALVKGPDGIVQSFLHAHFGLFPLAPPPPPSDNLFGPVIVGPFSRFGVQLDSMFVNPPSDLPVVYHYLLDVSMPPYMGPFPIIIDTAAAWINDELVFEYRRMADPDTAWFAPQTIPLREGLVNVGDNTIRIYTNGNEYAAAMWRVYRSPMIR